MKKIYEIEMQRQNVTPREFFRYVANQLEKRAGVKLTDWVDSFDEWADPTTPSNCDTKHEDWDEPLREICKLQPYDWQLYLQNTYNFIMEFDFYDEKTGFGYFYAYEMETETETAETETETETNETETNEEEKTMNEKNFENIRAAIESACKAYTEKIREHMTAGEYAENVLERNSTATRWSQYKSGTITREDATNYAMQRVERATAKSTAEKLAQLNTYENAAPIETMSIYVTWNRSRVWGYNPKATVYATDTNGRTYETTGTASGCGYDKRSAAVCEALNKIAGLRGMLCAAKNDKMTAADIENAAVNTSNADYIAYGAGYGTIPYFEGGCGMSATESVLNSIGLKMTLCREPARRNDVYTFTAQTAAEYVEEYEDDTNRAEIATA